MTRNSVKRLSLTFCLQQRHRQIWPSLYIDTHRASEGAHIQQELATKSVYAGFPRNLHALSRTLGTIT